MQFHGSGHVLQILGSDLAGFFAKWYKFTWGVLFCKQIRRQNSATTRAPQVDGRGSVSFLERYQGKNDFVISRSQPNGWPGGPVIVAEIMAQIKA
jgi:hypothetical protein